MTTAGRVTLVTGAAGFIGANLCRRLLEQGVEVHAFVRPGGSTWRIDEITSHLHIHKVDITDEKGVSAAVSAIRPTVVYHLATHGAYPFQKDGEAILLTNIFGLWNVLNACEEVGYELFVNTGSSSEYGAKQFAMREMDVLEPNSYYAVAKAGQSLLCQHFSRTHDRPIVTLRPFSVYGPYEEGTRLLPQLMYAALHDRPIDMVSPTTGRDFLHVDDVVDAYMMIDALKGFRGRIFNLGTGVQTSLQELIEIVGEVAGRPVKARWGAMEPRMWDSDVWVADISRIRRTTHWRPKISLREGIRRCLEWFEANRALYAEKLEGPC